MFKHAALANPESVPPALLKTPTQFAGIRLEVKITFHITLMIWHRHSCHPPFKKAEKSCPLMPWLNSSVIVTQRLSDMCHKTKLTVIEIRSFWWQMKTTPQNILHNKLFHASLAQHVQSRFWVFCFCGTGSCGALLSEYILTWAYSWSDTQTATRHWHSLHTYWYLNFALCIGIEFLLILTNSR